MRDSTGMSIQLHSDKKTAHGEKWPGFDFLVGGDMYVNPLKDKDVLCFVTDSVLEDMVKLVKSGLIGYVKEWASS